MIGSIVLPNHVKVEFEYSGKMHLPVYLSGKGIQNYEPVTLSAYLACAEIHDGDVFDVGANIGVYALSAAAALNRNVVAFEPFAPARSVLQDIADRQGFRIRVVAAAVGASAGKAEFYLSGKSDMSNSLNKEFRLNQHAGVETINVVALDDFGKNYKPTVVKIDTETTEVDVFMGSKRLMRQSRPAFFVEVLSEGMKEQLAGVFEGQKYTFVNLGGQEFQSKLGDTSHLNRDGDKRNWLMAPEEWDMRAIELKTREWIAKLSALPVP